MKEIDEALSDERLSDRQLQVLLLLRARRERQWTAIGVSLELQLELSESEEALDYLAAKGFLYLTGGNPPAFAYVHLSDNVDAKVQCLALAQEHHRHVRATSCGRVQTRKRKSFLGRLADLFTALRRST